MMCYSSENSESEFAIMLEMAHAASKMATINRK